MSALRFSRLQIFALGMACGGSLILYIERMLGVIR